MVRFQNRRFTVTRLINMASVVFALALVGCRDNTPPPPRVPVPTPQAERQRSIERTEMREREDAPQLVSRDGDVVKPLPPQYQEDDLRPPFDDEPLVSQQPPEQPAFVEAYHRVGAPRITLFVNRTLEGVIVPVNSHDATHAPVHYKESADTYLHAGQYDEVQAKSLDYEALENIMTDWLAANGKVTIISPTLARQKLSDEQVRELQAGRPQALSEVAQQLGADVLIQVQAHPTRQTREGLEVRIIAEAMNTKGGQSIGRAVVDVPPPLAKTTINKYTRYLARKLMDDMTGTWNSPPPAEMAAPPATQPQQ